MVAAGAVYAHGIRTRRRLGVPLRVVTWAVPLAVFAVTIAASAGFDSSDVRNGISGVAFGVGVVVCGVVFRSNAFALIGVMFALSGVAAGVEASAWVVIAGAVVFLAFALILDRKGLLKS
jgi:hypothetical protein